MANNDETKQILVETTQLPSFQIALQHLTHLSEAMPCREEERIASYGWYAKYQGFDGESHIISQIKIRDLLTDIYIFAAKSAGICLYFFFFFQLFLNQYMLFLILILTYLCNTIIYQSMVVGL